MKKISFCGISGSGMSALAQILKLSGYNVCGSDRNFDLGRDEENRRRLEQLGIRIFPQDGSAVTSDLDYVCTSTAVEDTIPDIRAAKEKNIPLKTRPQLLSEIFHSYTGRIAVAGTSGKTTTTAMIGYVLDKAGKKPCMINGGLLRDYENFSGIPNIIFNHGNLCVAEADESNGSIDLYNPTVSVINNISHDHKSPEEIKELFQNLINRTKEAVILNSDDIMCRSLKNNSCRTLRFSLSDSSADYYASDITPLPNGTSYVFREQKYSLKLIGTFNVANALAAVAAAECCGIPAENGADILQNFHGTKRRLEIIGSKKGITVIDDFAHNPDKVKASVSALRQYAGRLIVLFQPHGFSPMRATGKEIVAAFCRCLNSEDLLIMPEIFFAGGTVAKDISSADLINEAHRLGKENAVYFSSRKKACDFILQNARNGDRIVIMGARDNSLTDLCRTILERL